jgi:hypothetical protein
LGAALAPRAHAFYPCDVALTRGSFAALVALASAACGASPAAQADGPAPAGPAIRPGPPAVVRERVAEALGADGTRCEVKQKAVVCDADNPKRATLVVVYADDPPRLAMVLPFRLERPCLGAMPSLNAFNRDYDYVTLTCEDDGSLHATGVVVLPHEGLPPAELAQYAGWWRETTVATLRATHIAELLR